MSVKAKASRKATNQVRPDPATAAALDDATRAEVRAICEEEGYRFAKERIAELEAALDKERRRSARLGSYAFKLAGFTDDVAEEGALEEYFDVAIREVEILELATQSQSTFPVSMALGRLWDRMRAMNDGAEEIVAAAAQHRAFEYTDLRQAKVSP